MSGDAARRSAYATRVRQSICEKRRLRPHYSNGGGEQAQQIVMYLDGGKWKVWVGHPFYSARNNR
jgi:hypothetical protein